MIFLLGIICLLYLPAMGWLWLGAVRLPYFNSEETIPVTKFSIVIPFRNEAENLPYLLKSIMALKYPGDRFEILFINDASEDASVEIIEKLINRLPPNDTCRLKVLQNERISNSPKKDAITTAIPIAEYNWILTTDADCVLPENWLSLYDEFIQKKQPKMVCAPVAFTSGKGTLLGFQFLDGLSLQLITMGGFGWKQPLLANGANLGYLKSVFTEVNGYQGNQHIASGDDIFLLEKVRRQFPGEVHYIKNATATVITQPESSWWAIMEQRIRWASKMSKQSLKEATLLGIVAFLANVAFVVAFFVLALRPDLYVSFLLLTGIKIVFDFILLSYTARVLRKRFSAFNYFLNSFVYPCITIWVVLSSLRGHYEWKGRKFRK